MISNERFQALIACDRETLIALMAVAHASGAMRGGLWHIYLDPDIKALLDAAKAENARPVTLTPPKGWPKVLP